MSTPSTGLPNVSILSDIFDRFGVYVDCIDRCVTQVQKSRIVSGIVTLIGFLSPRIGESPTQDGISFVALLLHPRYSFAIESAADSDND